MYVVCVAISKYLNYGDFGFLRPTQKYASEAFIKLTIKRNPNF
jgi:hypothetical protein